jgi:cytochrome d ubiquinol oxidase subunit II
MELVHLWLGLVGLVVILYVILDGFSLGVAILFPGAKDEAERDIMMNSIAPVWDANQTWIVFGGFFNDTATTEIYTVLFSALYIPLLTFLFGLIFRGVAFEFRANASSTHKGAWNRAFFWGSLVAAFAQGLTLGAYISGITVSGKSFAGNPFDWLNPFSVMVGLALIAGYILLGSTYLIIKTKGPVQERAYRQAFWSILIVAGFMILVSIWTPLHDPAILVRWFSQPRIYFVWVFPLLGAVSFFTILWSLKTHREILPFISSLFLFISAYLGLQAGIYPYAILPSVTIYDAVAQRETLVFTLWGVCIILPVVLGYTIYSYWVFRGKVIAEEGYH